MKLPTQDSATGRAIKTAVWSISGFVIGLFVTVWAVPGVPNAVVQYAQQNWAQIALTIGIPSGVASFIFNYLRPTVKNY